jgi:N4-gp56 family major capsid protein
MTITTTSSLPAPVQQRFDMKLLSRPAPDCIHNIMALKKRLPERSGSILRMRRYNNLDTATVPLGPSGINPPAQTLTALDIDAKVNWYGTYVLVTDQVSLINEDPVLNETASLLAQSLRETEDKLTRDMLNATATVINCTGGGGGDNPTPLSRADIDGVIRTLATANAKRITDSIDGTLKFGTSPVRQAWFAMGHTDLIPNLEAVNGFISSAQYPSQMNILTAEWGSVSNIRFLLSSLGTKISNGSRNGNNLYSVYVTGQEAYGTIDLDGASAQFIYRPLGFGDDPLMLRQSAGFKFANAQRILNDQWIINMRCTTSVQY